MTSSARYTCVILDDNEIDRLTATVYVKKYPFLDLVGVFSSPLEALPFLGEVKVDVLFSDIDMPGLSGLEFRARMMDIPVCIFITAFTDYAAESFEMEALDFLVKPFKAERFEQCMNRVQHYLELKHKARLFEYSLGNENTVFIKDGHEKIKLNLHDIVYLEALKDYTRIITTSKKYSVLSPIGQLLHESSFKSFLRIHRSYAVQPHYIEKITAQQVLVKDHSLPVGRSYKEALSHLK